MDADQTCWLRPHFRQYLKQIDNLLCPGYPGVPCSVCGRLVVRSAAQKLREDRRAEAMHPVTQSRGAQKPLPTNTSQPTRNWRQRQRSNPLRVALTLHCSVSPPHQQAITPS